MHQMIILDVLLGIKDYEKNHSSIASICILHHALFGRGLTEKVVILNIYSLSIRITILEALLALHV